MKFGDITVFGDKTFEDLLEDIYTNSKTKSRDFDLVIKQLVEKIENTQDALLLMPLISDYSKIAVANDDHLIKLATVVQKFYSKIKAKDNTKSDTLFITDEERESLLYDLRTISATEYIELQEPTKSGDK